MKKYIIIFAMLGILACKNVTDKAPQNTESETRQVVEVYGNGDTSRIYNRIEGKIEGEMIDYYPSGALKGKRLFKDNQQIGKTILYFEDGSTKEVQYYQNGLKNGGDTVYHENGKLKFVVELKDDKKNGYLRKWGDDGVLIYEAKFVMDSLIEVGGESIK